MTHNVCEKRRVSVKVRYPQDFNIYTAHNIHNISLPLLMVILLAPPLGLKAIG